MSAQGVAMAGTDDVLVLAEETRRALLRADELIGKLRRGEARTLKQLILPLSRLKARLAIEVDALEAIEAQMPADRPFSFN
jgi:hypothetical protein